MEKVLGDITLDREWITLIKEAKNLGITIEEIREFFFAENKK